jgi:hypothetical protein
MHALLMRYTTFLVKKTNCMEPAAYRERTSEFRAPQSTPRGQDTPAWIEAGIERKSRRPVFLPLLRWVDTATFPERPAI